MNRRKKSLVLDLKHAASRQIFYELVRQCDTVYDNFRRSWPAI
jgi:crotonobetainyl-CoA:carnitine CoA-transferase CaiB-like acyl-CoA transferase